MASGARVLQDKCLVGQIRWGTSVLLSKLESNEKEEKMGVLERIMERQKHTPSRN